MLAMTRGWLSWTRRLRPCCRRGQPSGRCLRPSCCCLRPLGRVGAGCPSALSTWPSSWLGLRHDVTQYVTKQGASHLLVGGAFVVGQRLQDVVHFSPGKGQLVAQRA